MRDKSSSSLIMDEEIWKEIKNWEGKYFISSHGRLKSINGRYKLGYPEGYITCGCIDSLGYSVVTLRRPGTVEKYRIHVLVAQYFRDKPGYLEHPCVNHKDGDKQNNYYKNLEWTTLGGNVKHAVETGLMNLKGEKNPMVKLTELRVIEMRMLRKQGLTHQAIADRYGVCRRQASDVIRGVNWGWLATGL